MSTFLLSSSSPTRAGRPWHGVARSGFTLIELLVVIGIIVILIAILIPAAAAVRKRAYATSTSQELASIGSACHAYYQDYHSYPGPLSDDMIDGTTNPPIAAGTPGAVLVAGAPFAYAGAMPITSSENLVLGLTGGLNLTFTSGVVTAFTYTPGIITQASGPQSLNTLLNSQKQTSAYFSPKPEELPPTDTTAAANYLPFGTADSVVPEYLDHIPGNVITPTGAVPNLPPFNYGPILYFRARVSATGIVTTANSTTFPQQYNFAQAAPYGFILSGIDTSAYPAGSNADSAVTYFSNPALTGQPKGKDAFILISAGSDRIFGTSDDIIYGN
jgi:prepilin-type N-terminal cleavage/methylation domain-containing protein